MEHDLSAVCHQLGITTEEAFEQAYQDDPINKKWAYDLYIRASVVTAKMKHWCDDQLAKSDMPDERQAELFDLKYGHMNGAIR